MSTIIDFTGSKLAPRALGGSDRKFRIQYDGKYYMLKFTEEHVKKTEISTSHENNAISEYVSSHISQSVGLPTHNTILGLYNNEVCVACEDFRTSSYENIEFTEFARAIYGPSEFKKIAQINQLYQIYNSSIFPSSLKEKGIQRYWDTFVLDALVGNFDRHTSNWGLLVNYMNEDDYKLAPIYDYGSTLFPIMSDEGAKEITNSNYELLRRCLVFPSATLFLTKEKTGKPGYYDMLASNYDEECTKSLLRIFPRINLNRIFTIVDETPLISEQKKEFYKKILQFRYEVILERAYIRCLSKDYDKDSQFRLNSGISINDKMLIEMMNGGVFDNLSCMKTNSIENQSLDGDLEQDL